jgi:hypothetical protein
MSNKPVWWRCSSGHEWEVAPVERVGNSHADHKRAYMPGSQVHEGKKYAKPCPHPECRPEWGWTVQNIRNFVASILPYISTLTAAELQVVFDANGFDRSWRSKTLALKLLSGAVSAAELEPFVQGRPAPAVEALLPNDTGEIPNDTTEDGLEKDEDTTRETPPTTLPVTVRGVVSQTAGVMKLVQTDEAAVLELVRLAVVKLWRVAFEDEEHAVEDAKNYSGDTYADRLCSTFLREYAAVKALPIPEDYSFTLDGVLTLPNLMQRLVAWQLQQERRRGNWSGTGAGKTNSGIYASRVIDAKFTIITCPNNVVDMWERSIHAMFPGSQVATKTFHPIWSEGTSYRYLVLNYELLQRDEAVETLRALAAVGVPDLIIIDEIQLVKQRHEHLMSKRRHAADCLTQAAQAANPALHVLGLSATPVINSLREGSSLLQLITRETLPVSNQTISSCVAMHRAFMRHGIRWVPNYALEFEEQRVPVSCDHLLPEIMQLRRSSTPLDLEQILTKARLPIILSNLQSKTIVYTHNVDEIVDTLEHAITLMGWKTGRFTGEDKSGMAGFVHGDVDILIASSAIVLGIDGLQHVCNNIVINVLPWTCAELDQLKGRVYRQGQRCKTRLVIPVTYATVNGERWSWCESKLHRLRFKRTIGDAVADGVIPRQQLLTTAAAYQQALSWLAKLEQSTMAAE